MDNETAASNPSALMRALVGGQQRTLNEGALMGIDVFEMERFQCVYQGAVELNLSESGVKPLRLRDLLEDGEEISTFMDQELGYPDPPGSDALRNHIASWYPGASLDNVTVTNGGAEANFLASWTLLDEGGGLAFMLPNYLQGWGVGRRFATETEPYRLVRDSDAGRWALDVDSLRTAVSSTTKAIWVCNPNNPTGSVLSPSEMEAVVEAAASVGAWIISDEIYRGAELDAGSETPTFWGMYDRTVITSGVSKAFGLAGLGLGWVVAPSPLIEDVWRHRDYTTIMVGLLSDELAARALDPVKRREILGRTRAIVLDHVKVVDEWAVSNEGLISYVRPNAGAITYVEYSAPIESLELAHTLRRECSVLIVPGAFFGLEKGFRVGFGHDAPKTGEGLRRIGDTMRALVAPGGMG